VIESKPDNLLEDLRYVQRPMTLVDTALNAFIRAGTDAGFMRAGILGDE
jgi:hypothetical protein